MKTGAEHGTERSNERRETRAMTEALLAGASVAGKLVYRTRHRGVRTRPALRAAASAVSLNTVCPYYTMFPLHFPLARLARARPGEWVLDPFCGRGTTLFAARLRGLPCVGIDSNPVAAAIAAAKLSAATPAEIIARAHRILARARARAHEPREVPRGPFWDMCFHPRTLHDLCVLREHLLRACSTDDEVALRALLLGILHGPRRKGVPTYLSNQMPRTYATKPEAAVRFWRARRLTHPPEIDVLETLARRAHHTFACPPPPAAGEVHLGDARDTPRLVSPGRRFSWVITSPPYFGMRTYRPDQWLRNWFLGGDARVDYAQEGQLTHQAETFAAQLAAVWRAVARRCYPGARLIVRFGYLPSLPLDARELLRSSLARAEAGWRFVRATDAGCSSHGRRQARQFGRRTGAAAGELDACARLEP